MEHCGPTARSNRRWARATDHLAHLGAINHPPWRDRSFQKSGFRDTAIANQTGYHFVPGMRPSAANTAVGVIGRVRMRTPIAL
jgi:hypothetical protein